jgi:hypothetical protein
MDDTNKKEEPMFFDSDIRYFKYFIKSYHDNWKKGKLDDAYHDATAIVLHLEALLNGK